MKRTILLLVLSAPVALAGCGGFNQEAGAFLDGGTFGNATMHNHLVSTCKATTNGKLDTGKCAPRTLDGKYAKVTYDTYISSAQERPEVITSFRETSTSSGGN